MNPAHLRFRPSDYIKILAARTDTTNYKTWFEHCRVETDTVSGPHPEENNSLHFPFTVSVPGTNHLGMLHGGIAAWLIDTLSSAHVYGMIGRVHQVTMNLTINYLTALPEGRRAILKTNLVKAGGSVAFIEVKIVDAETPELIYCTGTHVKKILRGSKF